MGRLPFGQVTLPQECSPSLSPYRCDNSRCCNKPLNIELDGGRHGFPEQQQRDVERDAWLEARGVKVLRFWNSRLRREKQIVRDAIWKALQERAPQQKPDYCRPLRGESALP